MAARIQSERPPRAERPGGPHQPRRKVVKGGRRFSFSALVVVGDGQGHVGGRPGQGERGPGPSAREASRRREPLQDPARGKPSRTDKGDRHFGAGRVLLKPAAKARRDRAARCARCWRQWASRNILTKSQGRGTRTTWSRQPDGLRKLRSPEEAARGAAGSSPISARSQGA